MDCVVAINGSTTVGTAPLPLVLLLAATASGFSVAAALVFTALAVELVAVDALGALHSTLFKLRLSLRTLCTIAPAPLALGLGPLLRLALGANSLWRRWNRIHSTTTGNPAMYSSPNTNA